MKTADFKTQPTKNMAVKWQSKIYIQLLMSVLDAWKETLCAMRELPRSKNCGDVVAYQSLSDAELKKIIVSHRKKFMTSFSVMRQRKSNSYLKSAT